MTKAHVSLPLHFRKLRVLRHVRLSVSDISGPGNLINIPTDQAALLVLGPLSRDV